MTDGLAAAGGLTVDEEIAVLSVLERRVRAKLDALHSFATGPIDTVIKPSELRPRRDVFAATCSRMRSDGCVARVIG